MHLCGGDELARKASKEVQVAVAARIVIVKGNSVWSYIQRS